MRRCLLCEEAITSKFSWRWFFSWQTFEPQVICLKCQQKFSAIDQKTSCLGCGRRQKHKRLCLDCIKWQKDHVLLHNIAFYVYAEPNMRAYFERYKFQGDYRLRLVFAPKLQNFCKKYLRQGWAIVAIPLDQKTQTIRGFNQVKGFLTAIPTKKYLYQLKKTRKCPQSHKSRQERLLMAQPFGYSGPSDLQRKNILLVDDIYTTGSTLYHAAELLRQHNCGQVRSVTLAR